MEYLKNFLIFFASVVFIIGCSHKENVEQKKLQDFSHDCPEIFVDHPKKFTLSSGENFYLGVIVADFAKPGSGLYGKLKIELPNAVCLLDTLPVQKFPFGTKQIFHFHVSDTLNSGYRSQIKITMESEDGKIQKEIYVPLEINPSQ